MEAREKRNKFNFHSSYTHCSRLGLIWTWLGLSWIVATFCCQCLVSKYYLVSRWWHNIGAPLSPKHDTCPSWHTSLRWSDLLRLSVLVTSRPVTWRAVSSIHPIQTHVTYTLTYTNATPIHYTNILNTYPLSFLWTKNIKANR